MPVIVRLIEISIPCIVNNKYSTICLFMSTGTGDACANDAHVAMILGAAKILQEMKDGLKVLEKC